MIQDEQEIEDFFSRGLKEQSDRTKSYPSPTSGIADLPEQTRRWLAGDSIEPEDIAKTCRKLIQYLEQNAKELLESIKLSPKLTDELKAAFESKLDYFMKNVA